jgi:hypothetical protein
VWVNALWFLSLVISLTCALLATLLQQWARRYLKITQSRYRPHKRARIRAFFSEGVERCLLPWTVETLPTLLHLSLFLFFAGLVVFLCNVNLTIFKLVLSWVSLCTTLYGCITCMPIFRHDSPYYTPLSLPAWHIVTGILFSIYGFLRWFNESVLLRHNSYSRFRYLQESCRKSLVQGMQKTAEETALKSPPEIDIRAFMWTFDCLDEDHELENFFAGLPGFRRSTVVDDPLPSITEEQKWRLYKALRGLLYRTFSSDLLPALSKNRRTMICAKAVDPEHMPDARSIIDTILFKCRYSGPLATGIAKILRGWGNNADVDNSLYSRVTIAEIIARMQPRDDSWFSLASNELSVPEAVLRDYATHGDSLSLVILIHVVRQQLLHFRKPPWPRYDFSFVLATVSNFNVKNTSPKLQHDFCALWNQIVLKMQDGYDQHMAFRILGPIRNVYLALYKDADSIPALFTTSTYDWGVILQDPSSYPVCKVPDHCSDSTPHVHEDDTLMTIARAIPHDYNNTAFLPSLASPDPPSSTHTPLPVDESLTGGLTLDNQMSVPVSAQPVCQTMSENHSIPTSSRSPVTTCTVHGSVDPSGMMRAFASEPLTSSSLPKSNVSAFPLDDIAVGHTALSCTPSVDLTILSLPPTPVLGDELPTGLFLFSCRGWI